MLLRNPRMTLLPGLVLRQTAIHENLEQGEEWRALCGRERVQAEEGIEVEHIG